MSESPLVLPASSAPSDDGLAQRVLQNPVAHEPAVHEDVLAAALRRVGRAHGEARHPHAAGLGLDRRRAQYEIVPEQLLHAYPARS